MHFLLQYKMHLLERKSNFSYSMGWLSVAAGVVATLKYFYVHLPKADIFQAAFDV